MRYLKTYEKFDLAKEKVPLEIKADMTLFNQSEMNKKQFDKYKAKLQQIYNTYLEDETPSETGMSKDLYNKLIAAKFIKKTTQNQIIWKNPDDQDSSSSSNPLFSKFAEQLQQERNVKKSEETLKQKQKDLENKQKALSQNQGDTQVVRQDIDNTVKDIQGQETKLKKSDLSVKQLKTQTKKDLDLEKKKLEDAKKRIQALK